MNKGDMVIHIHNFSKNVWQGSSLTAVELSSHGVENCVSVYLEKLVSRQEMESASKYGAGGPRGRMLGTHALNYTNILFRVCKWMNIGMINFAANMDIWGGKLRPDLRIAEKS